MVNAMGRQLFPMIEAMSSLDFPSRIEGDPFRYTSRVRFTAATMVLLALATAMPSAAQERDVVDYDIEVALDPATHELEGSMSVRWRNTGGAATSEIWLHLYLNAFAGSETTLMRELEAGTLRSTEAIEREWGWTRITALRLPDGTDLSSSLRFERPDDGNEADFSAARVELPREVPPGESVTLEIDFEARLPRVVARTGFAGDFYMIGQWFPKIAVFEGERGWNCHQYHLTSEFFADFGSYRVRMTIPRGWVLGATGEQVSRAPVGTDDRVEFRAVDVHDFAWMTAPPELMAVVETDFEPGRDLPPEWLERAGARLDLGAAELELPPMKIRLLVPRSQESLAPRMLRAARLAIAWFGLHLGPYPQPQLTVVSPPPGAEEAGGMEYPTLITTGASRLSAFPPMSWSNAIEAVTVHEFGHQYFQGLLASDEAERAWLDEGLTTWAENRCIGDIIADRLAPEIRFAPTWGVERLWLSFEDPPVTVDRRAWDFRRLMDYFLASYTKSAVAVRTLEGLLGEERVARAMRAYFSTHRYRHPTGDDFQRALEEATGEELEWFFAAAIRGDATADWAVLAVRQREVGSTKGLEWRDGEWFELDETDEGNGETDQGSWAVDVEIGRLGDLIGPVEVELEWADGRRERRVWDSVQRWVRWSEASDQRLARVTVDPDGRWALETRRADNYWRDEATGSGPLWWVGGALRMVGLLTVPWS